MKITVRQLKQLIREQVEEAGFGSYGRDDRSDAERERDYADSQEREREAESARRSERYRAESEARLDRARENERLRLAHQDEQDRNRRARASAAERQWLDYFPETTLSDPKKVAVKWFNLTSDQKFDFSQGAPVLNDQVMNIIKRGGFLSVRHPNGKRTHPDDNGKYYIKNVDPKPGLLGLGFMGLEEEIQQMVKEELRRQLKNRR